MANRTILKKSSIEGKIPSPSDLVYGELALNYTDGKLYYKNSNNQIEYISGGTSAPPLNVSTINSLDEVTGTFEAVSLLRFNTASGINIINTDPGIIDISINAISGTSFNFDGGVPSTNYTIGPAFDCGGVL